MIALAAAIVACTALGVWADRRRGDAARRAAHGALDAIFYGLLPFVTFVALARLHITAGVGGGIGLDLHRAAGRDRARLVHRRPRAAPAAPLDRRR